MKTDHEIQTHVNQVISYISSLEGFELYNNVRTPYWHMGATITDAILQPGLRYETVVSPRVRRVMNEYPNANTSQSFYSLLLEVGPMEVLVWRGEEKPSRLLNITKFFSANGINDEQDLSIWLCDESNIEVLLAQRGIGRKTVDYLKMLVGIPAIAVDRHLARFVDAACSVTLSYSEARAILSMVAQQMCVDMTSFDYSVWAFMSRGA